MIANWSGNLYKENEKVRKKERKHALDQENDQEKKKVFRLKNINQFYFQPLGIVSALVCSTILNISKKWG